MTTRVVIQNLGPKKVEVLLKFTSLDMMSNNYSHVKTLEVDEKLETYVYNFQDVVIKEIQD